VRWDAPLDPEVQRGTCAAPTRQRAKHAQDRWFTGPNADGNELNPARIDEQLEAGTHTKTIASKVAAWSGRDRHEVYARVVERHDAHRLR
jgi:hypothetical protein